METVTSTSEPTVSEHRTLLMKKSIHAKVLYEALHHWPKCDIEEVAYLKTPHRHVFHILATVLVSHSDRDVEFIVLQHRIKEYLEATYKGDFGAMSCESIAEDLIHKFDLSACSVFEDGENGATVEVESVTIY